MRLARVEADRARYVAEGAELAAHQAKAADAVRSAAAAEADCARRVRDAEAACELARREASHQRDVANAEAARGRDEYRGLRADEAVEKSAFRSRTCSGAWRSRAARSRAGAHARIAAAADARVERSEGRETFEQREAASLARRAPTRSTRAASARRASRPRPRSRARGAGGRGRGAGRGTAEAGRAARPGVRARRGRDALRAAERTAPRRAREHAPRAGRRRAARGTKGGIGLVAARAPRPRQPPRARRRSRRARTPRRGEGRWRAPPPRTEVDDLGKVRAYEQLELESTRRAPAGARRSPASPTRASATRPWRRASRGPSAASATRGSAPAAWRPRPPARSAGDEDALAAQAAAFRARADLAVARLATAEMPTQFLLQALQERDAHAARLRARLHAAEKSAAGAVADAEGLATHNARLEAEVHKLVQHRAELQHLKHHVARLRAQPPPRRARRSGPAPPVPARAAPSHRPSPALAPATSVHTTPRRADAQPFHTRA